MSNDRPSRRQIERRLDDLETAATGELLVVHEDPKTGEWYRGRGEDAVRVDEVEAEAADQVVVIHDTLVMERSRAIEEGFEILGPAEDVPNDRDIVRVASGER